MILDPEERVISHRTLYPAQGLERGRNGGEPGKGHDVHMGMTYNIGGK